MKHRLLMFFYSLLDIPEIPVQINARSVEKTIPLQNKNWYHPLPQLPSELFFFFSLFCSCGSVSLGINFNSAPRHLQGDLKTPQKTLETETCLFVFLCFQT